MHHRPSEWAISSAGSASGDHHGAPCRIDRIRWQLRVVAGVPVGEMTGAGSWRYLPEPSRSTFCRNMPKLTACWDYRCAAHEYRLIAGGHCHFLLFNRLMPWDHAPGVLLHLEAGGYAAAFDGSPYSPLVRTGSLICTPDRGELARVAGCAAGVLI